MTTIFPAEINTLPGLVDFCSRQYGDRIALTRTGQPDAASLTFRQLADTVHGGATHQAAIRLWERLGFHVIGEVPGAFRHPELGFVSTLVMHRDL